MIKNLLLKVGNKHRFILKINMIFAENNIINLKMKKSIKNIIIIIMLINNLLNSYKINLNKMNLNEMSVSWAQTHYLVSIGNEVLEIDNPNTGILPLIKPKYKRC